jgi:hypothetical protein
MNDLKLVVGMTFTLMKKFIQTMRTFNLFRGNDVKFTKNDRDNVIGVCRVCRSPSDSCPWRVYSTLASKSLWSLGNDGVNR